MRIQTDFIAEIALETDGSGWPKELGAACLNFTKSILDHNLAATCHVVGYKLPSPLPLSLLPLQPGRFVSCPLTCLPRIEVGRMGVNQGPGNGTFGFAYRAKMLFLTCSALTLIVLVSRASGN